MTVRLIDFIDKLNNPMSYLTLYIDGKRVWDGHANYVSGEFKNFLIENISFDRDQIFVNIMED